MRGNAVVEARNERLNALALGGLVFVSGAAVMIYEFIAVRILQSDFGSTVEVWAGEIAVCMAGLALGYFIGGWLADRWSSWIPVGLMIAAAGLTALLIKPLAKGTAELLFQTEYGVVWHPLIAALVSSFLPLFALGTILPQAIRLRVQSLDKVGAATGWIASISTVGSIAGVLLVSMYLLQVFGVMRVLAGVSVFLIAFGLAVAALAARGGRRVAVAAALTALLAGTACAKADILFERYTAYHHILVEDLADRRVLRFDNSMQTIMFHDDPTGRGFEYTEFFHVPMIFNPAAGRALFIGLGGGTGPKAFLRMYPEMRVQAVEIDPVVINVAEEYFGLPDDPRLDIVTLDGRVHVRRSKETYDIVILDAYASSRRGAYLPYHLVTKEFFELVDERLARPGYVVYNVVGVDGGYNTQIVRDVYVTMKDTFDVVYAFAAKSSLNTVFVAVKTDEKAGDEWPEGPVGSHPLTPDQMSKLAVKLRAEGHPLPEGLEMRVRQTVDIGKNAEQGRLLTDDFAPVDLMPMQQQ